MNTLELLRIGIGEPLLRAYDSLNTPLSAIGWAGPVVCLMLILIIVAVQGLVQLTIREREKKIRQELLDTRRDYAVTQVADAWLVKHDDLGRRLLEEVEAPDRAHHTPGPDLAQHADQEDIGDLAQSPDMQAA